MKLNQKIYLNNGFGQCLAYNGLLGIKKHVLKLGNSIAATDKSFEPIQNQTKPKAKNSQNNGVGKFLS